MEQAKHSSQPENPATNPMEPLRLQMNQALTLDDIQTLTFALSIDYENLPGQTKNGKIISLLNYVNRHNQLAALETWLKQQSTQTEWSYPHQKAFIELDPNRTNFLNALQTTWIDGFLHQSLHNEVLKLTMTEANGGLLARDVRRRNWQMVKQQTGQADEAIALDKPVGEMFDECGRAMLILGAPGSGKTITLLQLAEDLLAEAHFPGQPMPVVLNLSSWAQEKQALADWLEAEIFVQYGVGRNLAKQWLESNSLIYLLDGLDEVAEDARDACITAVNQFREDKPGEPGIVPMVVCSRMADYELLNARLNLNTAIQIQPLSDEQVDSYLSHEKLELQTVRGLLQEDPPLRELTRSPLLLNVMTLAYKGKKPEELQQLDTTEARRQHLFDAYIDAMFAHRPLPEGGAYREADARHWLMEVAYGLTKHNVSELYLEKLQPDWLPAGKPRRRYAALHGFIFGLSIGLIVGLSVGLIVGLSVGLLYGLLVGLFAGLFFRASKNREQIELVEELKWRLPPLHEFLKAIKDESIVGLFVGTLFGGTYMLIVQRHAEPIFALLVGLRIILIFALLVWLLFGLGACFEKQETQQKLQPNQGIRSSRRNLGRMSFLYFVVFSSLTAFLILLLDLSGWLVLDSTGDLSIFIAIMAALGMIISFLKYGGDTVIKHYTLRWLLARNNILPYPIRDKKLIAYLDAMVERILLRRTGNGYMFIHRSLLEHFAAKHPLSKTSPEPIEEIKTRPIR